MRGHFVCWSPEDDLRGNKKVHLYDQSVTGDVRALEDPLTALVARIAEFDNTPSNGSACSKVKAFYIGMCQVGRHE